LINDRDVAERRRVPVLGNKLAKLLFEQDAPVGSRCPRPNTPLTRSWVMRPKRRTLRISSATRTGSHSATTHYALFG